MVDIEQHGFSDDAIRRQLQGILNSPDFDASPRNRKFLAHVVEQVLAGRQDLIKAYTIATSVFGRSEDFDPQIDPIVRIEAVRLRRSLERYYLLSGKNEPIKFVLPKGTYAPVFQSTDSSGSAAPSHGTSALAPHRPSILVERFDVDADGETEASLAPGFSRRVVFALVRFADLDVFEAKEPPGRQAGSAQKDDVDFILGGAVTAPDNRLQAHALLTETRTGRNVWSGVFETTVTSSGPFDASHELAERVARAVGQPYGPILLSREREALDRPKSAPNAADGLIRFYRYLRNFDRVLHAEALAYLEQAVREEPDHAEAMACLAILRVDAVRFGYRSGAQPDELDQARALAAHAVELAPHASRCHHALGLALWFSGDVPGSLEEYRIGLELNPNDTQLMADFGLRLAFQADWDRSRSLLERAFAANPGLPSVFRTGLAVEAFVNGRFEEALAQARRIAAPTVVYGAMMRAVAAERLGLAKESAAAVSEILALDPDYGNRTEADLAFRNVAPEIRRAVAEGLRRAGLPV